MPLTADYARFVSGLRFEDLPPRAIEVAKAGIIDCIGVMIAGWGEPAARLARAAHLPTNAGNEGPSSLGLSAGRADPATAALLNGTAAHALDFDDAENGHRSAVLVPVILASMEALGASGRDMLLGYVAGYEIWAELVTREQDLLYDRGWHPTAVLGAIAAAAAAARLHGLDPQQTAVALAIAASKSSGLEINFGTMTKPYHAGLAARSGVEAARLAAAGFTASTNALEAERGFLAALSPRGRVDRDRVAQLEGAWRITTHGVNIKKFPVCYSGHRSIDAALALRQQHGFAAADVARVELELGRPQLELLRQHRPRTALEAKFSAEFAVASAIEAGQVGLAEVADDYVNRPEVQQLIERVHIIPVDEIDPAYAAFSVYDRITVELKDGRRLTGEPVTKARGHFSRPLTDDDVALKFRQCLTYAHSPLDAAATLGLLRRLETLEAGWSLALSRSA